MEKTTIQIKAKTLEKLRFLKTFERQSYDEILNNLLNRFDDEPLSVQEIKGIQQGLEDIKKGNVYPIEEVAKELRINLD